MALLAVTALGLLTTALAENPPPRFHAVEDAAGLTVEHDPAAHGDFYIWESVGPGVTLLDYDSDGAVEPEQANRCLEPAW